MKDDSTRESKNNFTKFLRCEKNCFVVEFPL